MNHVKTIRTGASDAKSLISTSAIVRARIRAYTLLLSGSKNSNLLKICRSDVTWYQHVTVTEKIMRILALILCIFSLLFNPSSD